MLSKLRIWIGATALAVLATSGGVAAVQAYDPPATSPFTDVSTGHVFYRHIAWLSDAGISTGYGTAPNRTFQPASPVLREQMAAFLYRLAGSPAYEAPATSPFTDVSAGHVFYRQISWLAAQNISTGYDLGGGRKEFRPGQPVLREQMAAFLYRFEQIRPDATVFGLGFGDVQPNHAFKRQIDWLADRGVSTGYPGPPDPRFPGYPTYVFQPSAPVLREQMAAFMFRLKDVDVALAPPVDVPATATGEIGVLFDIGLFGGSARFGAPDTWDVHAGALPPGLTVRLANPYTGVPAGITGRPWAVGTFTATVRFRSDIGKVAYRDITITVTDPEAVAPEDAVTRAELAQEMYDELRPAFEVPTTSPFTDLPTTHPHFAAAAWAHSVGAVEARRGAFEPDGTMTRADLATHGYRADESTYEQQSYSQLVDIQVGHPAYHQLHWAYATGILLTTGRDLIVPARLASKDDARRLGEILAFHHIE